MSDNLLNEIAETARLNLKHYYLKFFLNRVREPLIYEVTKDEWEGVSHWFHHRNPLVLGSLLTFTTTSERVVNVNPKYIALCQELWDVGMALAKEDQSEEEDVYDLIMYVDGISEPLCNVEADPADIDMIAAIMEAGEDEASEFVTFIDQDGERNWLIVGNIMLMESIEYREELEDLQAELEATSRKKRRRPKAQKAREAPQNS